MAGFKNECWKWMVVGLVCASACGPMEAAGDDAGGSGGGNAGSLEMGSTSSGSVSRPVADAGPACTPPGGSVAEGAVDPNNPCQLCDPTNHPNAWSQFPDGTPCQTDSVCVAGVCTFGCFIGGAHYQPGAPESSNDCQTCQPGTSTAAWTPRSDETACNSNSGDYCSGGSCVAGCLVAGQLYSSAQPEASDTCQVCDPADSSTAFTAATDGTACGQGGTLCVGGSCDNVCDIRGAFVPDGTMQPSNPNECCNTARSSAVWTPGFEAMDGGPTFSGVADFALGDVTNDGVLDMIVATSSGIDFLAGKGDGTFSPTATIGDDAQFLAIADVNWDGRPDVVAVVQDAAAQIANVTVLLNSGTDGGIGFQSTSYEVPWPVVALAVGAYAGNGLAMIAVVSGSSTAPASITALQYQGNGTFATGPKSSLPFANPSQAIALNPFVDNSSYELVVVDGTDQALATFIYSDPTGFQLASQGVLPVGSANLSLAQADVNQDGYGDLLVGDVDNDNLLVLLSSPSLTFESINYFSLLAPARLMVGDFNGDGVPDVAASNGPLGMDVLINETAALASTAAFYSAAPYRIQGAPPSTQIGMATGDVNGDGRPDVVLVGTSTLTFLGSCP